jgi:hypothetical protein
MLRISHSRAVLCGLVLAWILAGCTHGDAVTAERVIPERIAQLMDEVGPPQAAWLEDGRVTNAELEAAFYAAVACINRSGATVEAEYLGAGDYQTSSVGDSEASVDQGNSIVDQCFRDNYELTATVYATLYGPTEQDYSVARQLFVSCANDLGIPGSDRETIIANYQGRPSIAPCSDREAEYLRQVTIERAG